MFGRKKANSIADSKIVIPYQDCPAKTYTAPDSLIYVGRSTLNHCQIVGTVARELINRFPHELRDSLFPSGSELAAAAHDIGKVSPCFYEKIRRACAKNNSLKVLLNINPKLETSWGGHAGVSQVAARALNVPKFIPEILGQHHGFSPAVVGKRACDENFGGPGWQKERHALVEHLKSFLAVDWPEVSSIPQARLLAGLTSVSDWVGSGQFFENPDSPWKENISQALDDAGFIPPTYRLGLSFEQVYGFSPRSAQHLLIEQITSPGVYILEAPMGIGKTEAALYAAYQMLTEGKASGIYFALPTQLTSNKIYERFNEFLKTILSSECKHRSLLLHGNAWLLDTEMGEEGRPGGAWFNHAKRGLLAPFAVGTIDQALMAAMNVKHGFVRAFGLAGKVVILDEVHTYDAYTGTLLDALVELLRDLHCTVIILSATLNHDRRESLVKFPLVKDDYPLITAVPHEKSPVELSVQQSSSYRIDIHWVEAVSTAIEEVLLRASQGQQVLWIENTVIDAQKHFLDLAARSNELGIACGLLHSRFTVDDRQRIEDHWVKLFGKPCQSERNKQGRILVGTQVLEQSLDIDADFMVSRFAPTDMILQRLGRLWRHKDRPRNQKAACEAWLLAPPLKQAIEAPPQAFGATAFVYSPYVLCRSLEVWQGRQSILLPTDIRSLIEDTYTIRAEEGMMGQWLHELDNGTRCRIGRKAMQQLARITLSEAGNTLPENKAQTRYSETDSHEVLLLRNIELMYEKKVTRITLLNGKQLLLPWRKNEGSKKFSSTLMRQIVLVRDQDAPKALPLSTLKKFYLQNYIYLGKPEFDEALLRVALVDEIGALQNLQGVSAHDKHTLNYSRDFGYQIIKTRSM